MEVVLCKHQVKLREKTYGVMLVELALGSADEQEQIKEILNRIQYFEDDESFLVWTFNREQFRFKMKEIYYIYSYLRKAEVHTHRGVFRIHTTLAHEEVKLSKKGFIRVHQGYLVRKEVVRCVGTEDLILENDTHIPISSKYKKNVKNMLEKS